MIPGSLTFLLNEVLHGTAMGAEGTCFVQGDEALIQTLKDLTAQEASIIPAPGTTSIAAHLIHTNYYLWITLEAMKGTEPKGDWPGSWAKTTVNEQEFQAEIAKLETQVKEFISLLPNVNWEEDWNLINGIANIGHAAYHLGAIRQLYCIIKAKA
ncbi:MAG: DinB family protein [Fimbriimonadaceae bacterium]